MEAVWPYNISVSRGSVTDDTPYQSFLATDALLTSWCTSGCSAPSGHPMLSYSSPPSTVVGALLAARCPFDHAEYSWMLGTFLVARDILFTPGHPGHTAPPRCLALSWSHDDLINSQLSAGQSAPSWIHAAPQTTQPPSPDCLTHHFGWGHITP